MREGILWGVPVKHLFFYWILYCKAMPPFNPGNTMLVWQYSRRLSVGLGLIGMKTEMVLQQRMWQ